MHDRVRERPTLAMIVLLGAMTAFGAISIDMYLPALPAIGADLHASPAAVQHTLSSLLLGLAIGQLVYGPLSDRVGRRPPLLFGTAVYIVASLWCALVGDVTQLAAARFVQGFGACAALVVSRAVVRDRYSHTETARILSLISLVFGLVPILAPLAGGWILALGDWRLIFWVLTGFGAVVGGAILVGLPESRSAATAALAHSETPLASYRQLLAQPRLLGYMLGGAFNGACLFTYLSASPDLLIGTYGVDEQHFGWFFGANSLGLVAASQVNRRLLLSRSSDEVLGRAVVAALGFGLVLTATAATGFAGMWGVLVPLFFVIASFGFMFANTAAGALSVDPMRSGAASGLMGALGFAVGGRADAVGALPISSRIAKAGIDGLAICGAGLCLCRNDGERRT